MMRAPALLSLARGGRRASASWTRCRVCAFRCTLVGMTPAILRWAGIALVGSRPWAALLARCHALHRLYTWCEQACGATGCDMQGLMHAGCGPSLMHPALQYLAHRRHGHGAGPCSPEELQVFAGTMWRLKSLQSGASAAPCHVSFNALLTEACSWPQSMQHSLNGAHWYKWQDAHAQAHTLPQAMERCCAKGARHCCSRQCKPLYAMLQRRPAKPEQLPAQPGYLRQQSRPEHHSHTCFTLVRGVLMCSTAHRSGYNAAWVTPTPRSTRALMPPTTRLRYAAP